MAKIIVSAASNINWTKEKHLDSFVEGMINALERTGNTVLNIRVNDFVARNISLVDEKKLGARLKAFKPDLLITFNNVFPYKELLEDVDCPVACFAADSCAFFLNKDAMRKYVERYYFFNFSNDTIAPFYEWFPFIAKERVHLFGHVSDLRAQSIEQDINLSFIGSIATWNKDFTDYFKTLYRHRRDNPDTRGPDENAVKNNFFRELDRFKNDPHSEFKCDMPYFKPNIVSPHQAAILLLTGKMRFDILSRLTDLGLKIFGYPDVFADMLIYNYDLFRCFDFTTNATMAHATLNYNRSKVSLNLPHAHTKEGLSWRVCDILASNAVLLSSRQPDLVQMTKGYVDLPMYESPQEAREIAIKLLKDDIWRKELALGCQQMMDDKYRFENKLRIVEDAIPNISLRKAAENVQGKIEYLDETPFIRKGRVLALSLYRTSKSHHGAGSFKATSSLKNFLKAAFFKFF